MVWRFATTSFRWRCGLAWSPVADNIDMEGCLALAFPNANKQRGCISSLLPNQMHPTLYVLVVLEVFTTFTTSLTVPIGPSLSQNAPVGVDVSANSSLASPSFSSAPSANTGLAVNPEVREYTVFPQQPQKVAQVASAIQAFAVQDSVRTITDKYRPEYDYILYWQFRALPDAAQQLREQLGSDVGAPSRL
jgi:hypothetical protein